MVSLIQPGTFQLETNGNLGAVEIMTFLSLILLGISLSLGYTFFRRSEGDRFSLKVLVAILLVLEVFHSFTASHTVYYETVTRWNRGEANSYPLSINVLSENLITFLVQWFFSHRIYRLSGSLLLSLICSSFAFLRFVGGIALSVESILDVPRNPNGVFVFSFRWLVITALAIGALADVLIAISMVYNLRKFASPLNLKSTTAALNRLVRWTLQTGVVTSMTSVTVIICFMAMSNMIWFALYIVLAKLYSISLLVSLNTRPRAGHYTGADAGVSDLQFEQHAHTLPISISFEAARQSDHAVWIPATILKA